MAMLLKLQESANYIESPEREGCLDPTLQATLWGQHDIQWNALLWLTQQAQSQWDFKKRNNKHYCVLSEQLQS